MPRKHPIALGAGRVETLSRPVRPPPVGATARSGHQGWLVGRGRAAVVFGVWRTRAGVASPLTTLA
jgi:hypothetical protein